MLLSTVWCQGITSIPVLFFSCSSFSNSSLVNFTSIAHSYNIMILPPGRLLARNVWNLTSDLWPISEVKEVKQMSTITMSGDTKPSIAIITALYCEKLAVDAMMENKTTFVRYKTEGKSTTSLSKIQYLILSGAGSFKIIEKLISGLRILIRFLGFEFQMNSCPPPPPPPQKKR